MKNADFQTQDGVTLIEIMVVAALVAIVATLAAPSMSERIVRNRVDSYISALHQTVLVARNTAISMHKPVTVCPSLDGLRCSNNWADGHMVFIDQNGNRLMDAEDGIQAFHQGVHSDDTLQWKAFQHKLTLQFLSTGITAHQNGSFVVCGLADPKFARAVIITKMGRPRLSQDGDGDGIHEGAEGKPLRC